MPPVLPRKRAASSEEESYPVPPKKKVDLKRNRRKPTLFDDLDASAWIKKKRPRKEVLDSLIASDYDCGHSTSSSDEFEDVPITGNNADDSSNENCKSTEFEDVFTSVAQLPPNARPSGDLELTLTRDTRISVTNPLGSKKAPSKIERQIRISTHKCHVQSLMWHNAVRNSWLSDVKLHEILLKQLPPKVAQSIKKWKQNKTGYHEITAEEDSNRRTRSSRKKESDIQDRQPATRKAEGPADISGDEPLFRLIRVLMQYWREKFKVIVPGLRKIGYMSLQRLDEVLKGFNKGENNPIEYGEAFRDLNDFRERAKVLEGSRDFGAQLFTALLRAIGMEVRMVASLQPIGFGWNQNEEALNESPQVNIKHKSKLSQTVPESKDQVFSDDNESIIKMEDKTTKSARKYKAKPKSKTRLDSSRVNQIEFSDTEATPPTTDDDSVVGSEKPSKLSSSRYDKDLDYPHYWTEILSPVTNTYTPIDAMVLRIVATNRELIEKFEPRSSRSEKMKQVIAYVIGHSSDGTAKDVTTRYLRGKMWPGKTKAYRYPPEKMIIWDLKSSMKRDIYRDWFKTLISLYDRGSEKCPRDKIDEHEDATDLKPMRREKKEIKVKKETLQYYKTSTEYVLERHMKREEALLPNAKHVKLFTVGKVGNAPQEKVFLRKDVVTCKSIESWHKEGRIPKPGEQPLKNVPFRAATKLRKRKLIEAEHALGEKLLQGLYSLTQTELIIPAPIQNGIIPKNEFGNVDLFVDTMLPKGAVHMVQRGIPKICRRLNIDFASAVTGFEFGNRMAVPIITGVLVAEEYHDVIMQEWHKDEEIRVEREETKRKKAALNMWKKLLVCQRVIKRCKNEYGNINDTTDLSNPYPNENEKTLINEPQDEDDVNNESPLSDDVEGSGGESESP